MIMKTDENVLLSLCVSLFRLSVQGQFRRTLGHPVGSVDVRNAGEWSLDYQAVRIGKLKF